MSKKTLSEICNNSLTDSKAEDLLVLDVENISSFADKIIIATATSNRHALSVSEKLVESLKENKFNILGVEGEIDSGWVLMDFGNTIVHLFSPDTRKYYDLDSLWLKPPAKQIIKIQ